jgi:tetratricopeptide (TPR) repeat protein/transcriptional regulator with XRE-family HTH domain
MAAIGDAAPCGQEAALGVRLCAYRQRALLTQEQLADRSGVSVRTIRDVEAGRSRRPRSESLRRLADALGLTEPERVALITSTSGSGGVASAPVAVGVGCRLPMDVAGFTGRADRLAQLDGLLGGDLGTPPTVVISAIGGTAGVGKTALAVHWAHRVAERFPDGQLFVNLRGYAPTPPLRPIDALAQFLHAVGVAAEQVPVEVEEAAGLYRSLLADKRMLVVLDNAASAEQVRPLLPASPGCLVLVTSRDRLGGLVASHGARRLTVDTLTAAEAEALLAHILGQRVAAEPQAAAELARLCAYLPLALRIAAANLSDQPDRPIADYLGELQEGNRLAALAVGGDEQGAVRAAFDLSYTALDPEAQRLFRLLGLVPGPDVTATAASALGGISPEQAGRLLHRLAGAHLLGQHTPGRYTFHDLLRLYARQRSQDEDGEQEQQAAMQRLLGWYLHTADAAARLLYPEKLRLPLPPTDPKAPVPAAVFDAHAQALAWLDAERANLLAAVQHAARHGPRTAGWLLADALRGYFVMRMHTVDWLAVAHAGLAAAQAEADLPGQAAAQLSFANAYALQSQYQQAVEHYTRALTLSRQTQWLDGQAAALGNLGLAYQELGQLQQAADHLTEALTLSRQSSRLVGQAASLGNLGLMYQELGRLEEAADHHRQALALNRESGSRPAEANDLANLGQTYHALGRLDDALDHLTRALAIHREVGDRDTEADTLRLLADVHRDAGRHSQALELAHDALALARDIGRRRFEADALCTLATVHQRLGQYQRAIDHHQEALRLARETEAHYPEMVALIGLAAAHQHLGHPEQALTWANEALTLARQGGYRVLEGQALTGLADLHLVQDHPDKAIGYAQQALDLHRDTGHRLGQAHTLLVLGRALRHTQGIDAALACWQQALALFTDIGSPDADQVHALVRTCTANGQ